MNFVSRLENYLEVAFKVVMMFGTKYFTLLFQGTQTYFFCVHPPVCRPRTYDIIHFSFSILFMDIWLVTLRNFLSANKFKKEEKEEIEVDKG